MRCFVPSRSKTKSMAAIRTSDAYNNYCSYIMQPIPHKLNGKKVKKGQKFQWYNIEHVHLNITVHVANKKKDFSDQFRSIQM